MNAASGPVVQTVGLVKDFGRTRSLDGLDLTVAEGDVHGFLGPNGAGKSTTIRALLGLIRPTSGTVRVLGRDPWTQPVQTHRDIAYVPGDVSLWPNLSGGEAVDLLTRLRGGVNEERLKGLMEEFEFDPRRKSRAYSRGNRQKVALIAAFAIPAKLYLLDEPTAGLDPVMDSVFRRQIQLAREDGATVLLSSHILSEVEQLCDRVTIIRDGKAVESGSMAELRHLRRTHFRVTGIKDPAALSSLEGVHDVRAEGPAVEFDADPADLGRVLTGLGRQSLTGVVASPPSLESIFLSHYRDRDGQGR